MFTKLQLQSACASRVDFQHGLDYFNNNRIDNFTCKKIEDSDAANVVEISATVRGTFDDYSARAVIDEGESVPGSGRIILDTCSCPGSTEKNRICKHCIALILKYLEMRDSGVLDEKDDGSYRQAVRDVPVETDKAFLDILESEDNRRRVEIRQKSREGSLTLVPYLSMSDISMTVEFKAGDSRLYIVKDVVAYVNAVKQNRAVSYGKNRSLVHSLQLFDENSRRLIDFLDRYEQNRLTYVKSYSAKNEDDGRYVTLKRELIDRFFKAVEGTTIDVHNATSKAGLASQMEFSEPEEALEAEPEDDGQADNEGASANGNFAENREKNDVQEEEAKTSENTLKTSVRPVFEKYDVVAGTPELRFTLTGLDGNGALLTGSFMPVFIGADCFVFVKDRTIYVADKSALPGMEPFFAYVSRSACRDIFIAEQDLRLFVPEMLQTLKKCCDVTVIDLNEAHYTPQPAAIKAYIDMPRPDVISCELYACYGEGDSEKRFNILSDRDYSDSVRNEAAEMAAGEYLKKYFNKYDPVNGAAVMVKDDQAFYEFITEQIYELENLGEVFVSDKLKSVKVKKASRITAGVSLQGDLLTFSIHSDDFTPEQLAEILKKYDRKKKFFRLTDGTFISVEGEGFGNLADVGKMLEMSGLSLSSGTVVVPKFRALFLDNELSDNENVLISRSKNFRALIRNMKTFEDNDFEVPSFLHDTLRNYQKHGFRWLKTLKNNGFGGILADEMGLGKTVQAIAFLSSEYEEGERSGALIVCPASLVYNWKSELERFAPNLPLVIVSGKQEDRLEILSKVRQEDVVITSYDLLRRDIDAYSGMKFGYQIIDEAQYIKNSSTLSSKAVKQINSGFRLALTGTPIENKLCELWSIFDYLMPGFLHDYRQFKEEYETPIVSFKDNDALIALRKIIHPFVLRRLKSDVLRDLPDKLEETVTARLTDEQSKLYRATLINIKQNLLGKNGDELKSGAVQILAELMRLRQICCDPSLIYENYKGGSAKIDLCIEIVKRAIDGGHKILIFSQFTSMLSIIEKHLDGEKIKYFSLVGQTPKEKRTKMVEEFNNDDVPVFCISLKAGGTGLNLTSADIVIHFDPWWNVAVQNQATDRAHRIGQKNIVTVYKLIASDTIEESIMKLQDKKKVLASDLLSGESFADGTVTREELIELLGGY
ncbi:MAG: DEAD/DEAH box helicase [Clostridia bacterium]|nr:DEAD/DEAH box helicase [Clostridia bacterium]